MKKLFLVLLCVFCLIGCSNSQKEENSLISYLEAKEKIINEGAILIDVRTESEYNENHIEGAILLTLDTINEENAEEAITTKDSIAIVYCQSGNRSQEAVEKLKQLGYTNVYDLGSISNWKE